MYIQCRRSVLWCQWTPNSTRTTYHATHHSSNISNTTLLSPLQSETEQKKCTAQVLKRRMPFSLLCPVLSASLNAIESASLMHSNAYIQCKYRIVCSMWEHVSQLHHTYNALRLYGWKKPMTASNCCSSWHRRHAHAHGQYVHSKNYGIKQKWTTERQRDSVVEEEEEQRCMYTHFWVLN